MNKDLIYARHSASDDGVDLCVNAGGTFAPDFKVFKLDPSLALDLGLQLVTLARQLQRRLRGV